MKLLIIYVSMSLILILVILFLFFLASEKSSFESLSASVFECGFSSYYFSRFSFSIHYFTVGLIFLFLDLELCFLLPFFNLNFSDMKMLILMILFILILVMGLLEEWKYSMLEWKF